jgi:alkylation response protein AidB-like acyl-CoA dehydrogenase
MSILDAEQTMLQQAVGDWARTTLPPHAAEWDAAGALPASVFKGLRDMGLCGICVPEKQGGAGLDSLTLTVVAEQIAQASAGAGWQLVMHNAAAWIASQCDDAGLAKQLASGRRIATWVDASHLDGGPAGVLPQVALPEGAVLLVSISDAVYRVDAAHTTAVDALGNRAAGLVDVQLDGTAAQIGTVAIDRITAWLAAPRTALSLGVAQTALNAAVQYAADRTQFGKPLAAFQAIQWMIADSATDLEGAREAIFQAAADDDTTGALALQAWAGEAAVKICDRAIQMHGGYGYTTEYPVERAWRDAQWLAQGGTAAKARAASA